MKALALTRQNWWAVGIAAIMVLMTLFAVQPVAAASPGNFDLTVYHGIKGDELGLSRELPVNIWVYKDGYLFAKINDFTYRERINLELPAAEYEILIESVELGIVIDSMKVGPVDITEGANLAIRAQVDPGKIPVLAVRARPN